MKIATKAIEPLVANPAQSAFRVFLCYGPDAGLASERAGTIMAAYQKKDAAASDLSVQFLDPESITDDPALLLEAGSSRSLFGGSQTLIRINDGDDGITLALKDYLSAANDDAVVIITAGELATKSSLRKLCEDHEAAASVACYAEDEASMARLVSAALRDAGYTIERDALAAFAPRLLGNRLMARQEIEKLITYKLNDTKNITLDDIGAVASDGAELDMDALVFAIGNGQTRQLPRLLDRAYGEGMASVALLRALIRHFQRLHLCAAKIQAGDNAQSAMKSLYPPVFFKYEDAFRNQLNRWPFARMTNALAALQRTEAACKQTGAADDILVKQLCLQLANSVAA